MRVPRCAPSELVALFHMGSADVGEAEFFAPRSIALLGASDNSGWAHNVLTSCQNVGFEGRIEIVHPTRPVAFGRDTVPSLRALTEPIDLAFELAPSRAVESVLDDAGAAGIRHAIVLAAGYGEAGEDGALAQQRLAEAARRNGVTLLGPNCLGFLNLHAKAAPLGMDAPAGLRPDRSASRCSPVPWPV